MKNYLFTRPKTFNRSLLIFELFRYSLLLLFLYTFYHKVIDLVAFEEQLKRSKILYDYAMVIKYAIPFSELFVVALLFVDKLLKTGLYMSLLLLTSFTFYLIALNNFSLFYGCSCGGVFNDMEYYEHIAVNGTFIILNILSIFLYKTEFSK